MLLNQSFIVRHLKTLPIFYYKQHYNKHMDYFLRVHLTTVFTILETEIDNSLFNVLKS